MTTLPTLRFGDRLAHYRVDGLIGVGGSSTVFRAWDETQQRAVALKILTSTETAVARARLLREARVLSGLRHPNVASVYESLYVDDQQVLVMQLVEGTTLDKLLEVGALPLTDTIRLGVHLAEGLAAAHARDVVHRDIKPGNLRVTPNGSLMILDFGIAATLTQPSFDTTTGNTCPMPIGTLPYMAPEQLRGASPDVRSDIFSAGSVLYEMAVGCRAFPHFQAVCLIESILHHHPVLPRQLNPAVPPRLERTILRALDKVPARRFQTAAELADALKDCLRAPARFSARKFFAPLTRLLGTSARCQVPMGTVST